ncbi:hypothetical protein Godav_029173 [Gossypium davidsonii]|uniref:DUF7745 domain-containing protein n=4 Tax=Gossypium TaxID=3633 RepID=A0A7J8TEB7_GOSDV|nr:hypothetical protein [Gossypium davidsonii]
MTQREKADSLAEGYVSESWDFTCISVTQNSLQELKEIWDQWNNEIKQIFYFSCRDLHYLLDIKKLMNITGMSEQWVVAWIKQKGDSKCIPWKNLKDLILTHPDTKKKVDVFALSIYGLVVFPKALRHVDEAVTDLFDRIDKRVTPVLTILAETFRSMNACRRAGEGRFIEFAQLLLAWFHSHFWRVDKARQMKRLAVGSMTTPEYIEWWGRRINDNIPRPSQGDSQPIEKHLRVVPSELEIIRQDFERRNSKLEKKIEQMEKEKLNLRLDMDVQKLEIEKLRRGENKAEEDLDSLKTDYKKLCLSMRTVRLTKTLEQWHQEI